MVSAGSCPAALVLTGAADTALLARALPHWSVRRIDSLDRIGHLPDPAAVRLLVLRSAVRVGPAELDQLPGLAHVIRAGSGLDRLDLEALGTRSVKVHRNPAPAGAAVAEWALAATLSLARRMPLGQAAMAAGVHLKDGCLAQPLDQIRVAVWGAGNIGRACVRALAPHVGEIVYAARPSIEPGCPQLPGEALPAWADLHINALPHTPTTHRLFGPGFLHRARERRPLLVCAGRLATIDVPACLEALDNGDLSGLALDPVERTDMSLLPRGGPPRNLITTPHIGAQRTDVRAALDKWVADLARTLARDEQRTAV
jgi:D-3-phosphoglycerate dehydrogenase